MVEELREDVKVIWRQLAGALANVGRVALRDASPRVFVVAQENPPREQHLLISRHVQAAALNTLVRLLGMKRRSHIHFPAVRVLSHRLQHAPPPVAFLRKARNLLVAS